MGNRSRLPADANINDSCPFTREQLEKFRVRIASPNSSIEMMDKKTEFTYKHHQVYSEILQ